LAPPSPFRRCPAAVDTAVAASAITTTAVAATAVTWALHGRYVGTVHRERYRKRYRMLQAAVQTAT